MERTENLEEKLKNLNVDEIEEIDFMSEKKWYFEKPVYTSYKEENWLEYRYL